MLLLPAHQTKHVQSLNYKLNNKLFINLSQLDNGKSNGTALWLGAQCLSLYLADNLTTPRSSSGRRPKVIELGSGIGLTTLTLASLGWDVLATDILDVISTVLNQNVAQNSAALPTGSGLMEIRELDWTVPPDKWTWTNKNAIASHSYSPTSAVPLLAPPFDLIVTSDTIYSPDLVQPLLRTLHGLCVASLSASAARSPTIYICIERREPDLIDRCLAEAKSVWGFSVARIPHSRVTKSMDKGGIEWNEEDWDGVEIWKLSLDKKHIQKR